jgi:predicted porin
MISHSLPRTTYTLAIFGTIRDRLDSTLFPSFLNKREENYGVRIGATHRLRRDLYGNVSFAASRANEFNGHDRILQGDAGVHYDVSQTLSVYLNTSIINRESTGLVGFTNGNLNDVRVTVGVNKAF